MFKRKLINKAVCVAFFATAAIGAAQSAHAIPNLQLYVDGGSYDTASQTWQASSDQFTLHAYLKNNSLDPAGPYYLSMAVIPAQDTAADLGSFTIGANTINVTSDMVFGVPPVETYLPHDGGDLGNHSIYPTYFTEQSFTFTGAPLVAAFDTQPGQPAPGPNAKMYDMIFQIDVGGLAEGYGIHFDLYNEKPGNNYASDIDVNKFCPFSHDAESLLTRDAAPVPEPGTMLLMGSGLIGLAGACRRARKAKKV